MTAQWHKIGSTKYGPVYHGPDLYTVLQGPDGWLVERHGLEPAGLRRARIVVQSWGPYPDEQTAFSEAEKRMEERDESQAHD